MKQEEKSEKLTDGKEQKYLKSLKSLKYVFIKYPWLWLLVLFILPLGVGWMAYDILTYSGNSLPERTLETVTFPIKTTTSTFINTKNNSKRNSDSNSNSQELPLWLILAIAFCCVSGSVVIFIILHNAQPIRKTRKAVGKRQ
ncbi:hypothetical protein H6F32_14870 [Anabaena sp. FACHB-1237]|nr:hypothetical protein [Anabaena sp. FACHB-1237]